MISIIINSYAELEQLAPRIEELGFCYLPNDPYYTYTEFIRRNKNGFSYPVVIETIVRDYRELNFGFQTSGSEITVDDFLRAPVNFLLRIAK